MNKKMTQGTVAYLPEYFSSGIFETDYQSLALAIFETYNPKTIAEFGCGPGKLTKELAKLGIKVLAIDGYSNPDFSEYPTIEFHPLDLNDASAIKRIFTDKYFDVAISMEVAELLQPESSSTLINWMSKVAPIVIFSASVPGQGDRGHINLQPREYWHNLFTAKNFVVADRIREKLRNFSSVAPWYRYNLLDYVHIQHSQSPELLEVINRLVASESASSTAYYKESTKLQIAQAYLNYFPVRTYLWLRQAAKHLLQRGRK